MQPFHYTQLHLSEEERRLRVQAEQRATALAKLLAELAHRVAPDRAEQCRRTDPAFFEQLDAAGWRTFWQQAPVGPSGWGVGGEDGAQFQALRRQVETLQADNLLLQQALAELRPSQAATTPSLSSPTCADGFVSSASSSDATPPSPLPASLASVLPERPPQAFAARFSNWPREGLALAVLATTGWSLRHAIAQVLADHFHITATAGSLKRLFGQLDRAGCWRMVTASFGQSSVVLVALTPLGRQVMAACGITVVEAELDLLQAHHGGDAQLAHAALVCAFTHQARQRGCTTQVCPSTPGPAQPDVLITRDAEQIYVEVEAESGDDERRMRKWRNLADLQGSVALCAPTPEGCRRLMTEAQAAAAHGRATDIDSLFKQAGLWVSEW